MQWYDNVVQALNKDNTYTYQDLVSLLRSANPKLADNSYRWTVGSMLKNNIVKKTGYNEYRINSGIDRAEYQPCYSDQAREIITKLETKFPQLQFTVFETVLLNDFLNHMIARNTLFIQVEKDLSAIVFRFLQEKKYRELMYKPSVKDLSLYWVQDCIIVTDLISEAPLNTQDQHSITIEQLLVDMYCDKLISSTYNLFEYPEVLRRAVEEYKVDKKRMLRYARRRNREDTIKTILTGIQEV